jgi:hypothetical protein
MIFDQNAHFLSTMYKNNAATFMVGCWLIYSQPVLSNMQHFDTGTNKWGGASATWVVCLPKPLYDRLPDHFADAMHCCDWCRWYRQPRSRPIDQWRSATSSEAGTEISRKLGPPRRVDRLQGCQICLDKSYQNKKIHQITAKLPNGHKIYQVSR